MLILPLRQLLMLLQPLLCNAVLPSSGVFLLFHFQFVNQHFGWVDFIQAVWSWFWSILRTMTKMTLAFIRSYVSGSDVTLSWACVSWFLLTTSISGRSYYQPRFELCPLVQRKVTCSKEEPQMSKLAMKMLWENRDKLRAFLVSIRREVYEERKTEVVWLLAVALNRYTSTVSAAGSVFSIVFINVVLVVVSIRHDLTRNYHVPSAL